MNNYVCRLPLKSMIGCEKLDQLDRDGNQQMCRANVHNDGQL